MTTLALALPFNLAKLAFDWVETKFSFVLSSIPGPRSGFQWGTIKIKAMSVLIPSGQGENHMSITAMQCWENLIFTLTCDAS